MLLDSHKKIYDGYITLSGKSLGAVEIAANEIANISGGKYDVTFKKTDDYAKKLVADKLEKEYVPNDEGFILEVDDGVTAYADTDRAELFAACVIRDMYNDGIQKGIWWSYPTVSHRSLRIFLPPKGELEYFYKLIDMIVHLGYNGILLEICGAMEFKRHPEINKAWLDYCASVNEYPDKYNYVNRGYYRLKNSVHTCNAGGGVYTQDEMREIIKYCKERFIEIVPEVPSLSHSEYLCVAYPDLKECADEPYAATACPSNPKLNELVFDLYDEVIDVFECKALHIGHDEWWTMCVCDKCKDKEPIDLYVSNVLESYNYLKSKGIKTYMWADKLADRVIDKEGEHQGTSEKDIYLMPADKEPKTINILGEECRVYDRYWFNAPEWVQKEGYKHTIPDMYGISKKLPPDIMYCHWCYSDDISFENTAFYKEGKDMIISNALPSCLNNYKQRFRFGAQGISVSNWAETSEYAMQEWGAPFELGYGSLICWNHERDELDFRKNVFEVYEELFKLYNRDVLNNLHIEVTYTTDVDWADGRKFYESMAMPDIEHLTIGNYEVEYEDGSIDKFPVMFSLNIGYGGMRIERCASLRKWDYMIDKDLSHTAPKCKLTVDDDKVWFTTVMPISGNVKKCTYVPKAGFENFVKEKEIKIIC